MHKSLHDLLVRLVEWVQLSLFSPTKLYFLSNKVPPFLNLFTKNRNRLPVMSFNLEGWHTTPLGGRQGCSLSEDHFHRLCPNFRPLIQTLISKPLNILHLFSLFWYVVPFLTPLSLLILSPSLDTLSLETWYHWNEERTWVVEKRHQRVLIMMNTPRRL